MEHCRPGLSLAGNTLAQKEANSYVYDHNTSPARRASRRRSAPRRSGCHVRKPESVTLVTSKVGFDQKILFLWTFLGSAFSGHQLAEDAKVSGAPTDSVVSLVPLAVEEHISSFTPTRESQKWVHTCLRTFIIRCARCCDSEFLFESSIGVTMKRRSEEPRSENPDPNQPPLQHLRVCEFGENGIPPMQYEEGEEISLAFSSGKLILLLASGLHLPRFT